MKPKLNKQEIWQAEKKYMLGKRLWFSYALVGKNGHDLCWWLNENPHPYPEDNKFWLGAWSISATWYGKYPFPAKMKGCLDLYRPIKVSEALNRRLADGKRDFTHHDLLHQGIGGYEAELFDEYFTALHAQAANKLVQRTPFRGATDL